MLFMMFKWYYCKIYLILFTMLWVSNFTSISHFILSLCGSWWSWFWVCTYLGNNARVRPKGGGWEDSSSAQNVQKELYDRVATNSEFDWKPNIIRFWKFTYIEYQILFGQGKFTNTIYRIVLFGLLLRMCVH